MAKKTRAIMRFSCSRLIAAAAGTAILLLLVQTGARAQTADAKPAPQRQQPEGDASKKEKVDEFAEAARVLGGPAANPECVWLGRRAVSLLWRDDLDTAFRHLELYDRFGCPSGHIQATFRCLVRQGNIDPKVPEALSSRVHSCWINPTGDGTAAAPSAAAPSTTTNR